MDSNMSPMIAAACESSSLGAMLSSSVVAVDFREAGAPASQSDDSSRGAGLPGALSQLQRCLILTHAFWMSFFLLKKTHFYFLADIYLVEINGIILLLFFLFFSLSDINTN